MNISGQNILNTEDYLMYSIKEPFWSAGRQFAWIKQEPGFGISLDIIKEAHFQHKKICIFYNGTRYAIEPTEVNEFYKTSEKKPVHNAKGVKLIVVPMSLFEVLEGKWNVEEYNRREEQRTLINNQLNIFR